MLLMDHYFDVLVASVLEYYMSYNMFEFYSIYNKTVYKTV
jgi:hypothetical protein